MTIYLIKGRTGDYEDTFTWTAKAFVNRNRAESYLKSLTAITDKYAQKLRSSREVAKQLSVMYEGLSQEDMDALTQELALLDPKAAVYATSLRYELESLEVDEN